MKWKNTGAGEGRRVGNILHFILSTASEDLVNRVYELSCESSGQKSLAVFRENVSQVRQIDWLWADVRWEWYVQTEELIL